MMYKRKKYGENRIGKMNVDNKLKNQIQFKTATTQKQFFQECDFSFELNTKTIIIYCSKTK